MKKLIKSKRLKIIIGIYLFLWLLTAIWGTYDIRRKFNHDFEYGYKNWTNERIKIVSLDSFYVYDLANKYNEGRIPRDGLFKYKSSGIAVAPFIVVDNIAVVWADLAGLGAARLNIWVPGYIWSHPIIVYWLV